MSPKLSPDPVLLLSQWGLHFAIGTLRIDHNIMPKKASLTGGVDAICSTPPRCSLGIPPSKASHKAIQVNMLPFRQGPRLHVDINVTRHLNHEHGGVALGMPQPLCEGRLLI